MMVDKQTAQAVYAKVASMSEAEREARVLELYELPHTPENLLEFMKLMFGGDFTVASDSTEHQ